MTRMVATLIAHDPRLQFRYGIYAAYRGRGGDLAGVLSFGSLVSAWALAVLISTRSLRRSASSSSGR